MDQRSQTSGSIMMRHRQNESSGLCCSGLNGKKAVKVLNADPNISFEPYDVNDVLGRSVRFFFSRSREKEMSTPLPLALFIQGSGCHSLFRKDEQGRMLAGYHRLLQKKGQGRVRVLAVEKPGVNFLDWPSSGSAVRCSQVFLKEHTLERWVIALHTALHAALAFPDIDQNRVLVVGHSEGGLVASFLTRQCHAVTHVGLLSSSSASQLYELVLNKQCPKGSEPVSEKHENERATSSIFETWKLIRQKPNSVDDFAWGHPFKRWSSFLATSTLEQLLFCKARIYAAHGTGDTVIPIESFNAMVFALREKNVQIKVERLENLDHGFRSDNDKGTAGIEKVLENFLCWALE